MDIDDCIVILSIIAGILYFNRVKENFELKRRGDVDGVYIQNSKEVMGVPIGTNEFVVDGVPIRNDLGSYPILQSSLQPINYNKTEGILPDPNTYNISTVLPAGVNEATLFSSPPQEGTKMTSHIKYRERQNILDELIGANNP
jgi:hypothetical protein